MKVVRETIVAGKTILQTIRVSSGEHTSKRGKRQNITPEKVKRNNDRLAVKRLTADLNANFSKGDFNITLTYSEIPNLEKAKKDRAEFLKTLRKEMRKQGKELKYIAVTEYKNKRPHHHIVVNCRDIKLLVSLWNEGRLMASPLDESGNYFKLAEYLVKETTKTFREDGSVHKRRYTCSRSIVHPVAKREEVSYTLLIEDPKPYKGYYILKDSIRRFEHPVTGLDHLEYIMIEGGTPRKRKVQVRGKAISIREYYKPDYFEEQMELDEIPFI